VVVQKKGVSALGLQKKLGLGSFQTVWHGCVNSKMVDGLIK